MREPHFLTLCCLLICLLLPSPVRAKEVISILYFDNTTRNKEYDWLSKGLADMLITDISNSNQIQVVERENLEKLMNEVKLALAGFTDEKQAAHVGRLLNASKLIYGSYIVMENRI